MAVSLFFFFSSFLFRVTYSTSPWKDDGDRGRMGVGGDGEKQKSKR
jgi:hypothetical protein